MTHVPISVKGLCDIYSLDATEYPMLYAFKSLVYAAAEDVGQLEPTCRSMFSPSKWEGIEGRLAGLSANQFVTMATGLVYGDLTDLTYEYMDRFVPGWSKDWESEGDGMPHSGIADVDA